MIRTPYHYHSRFVWTVLAISTDMLQHLYNNVKQVLQRSRTISGNFGSIIVQCYWIADTLGYYLLVGIILASNFWPKDIIYPGLESLLLTFQMSTYLHITLYTVQQGCTFVFVILCVNIYMGVVQKVLVLSVVFDDLWYAKTTFGES